MKTAILAILALAIGVAPALAQEGRSIRFGYGLNEESTQGEGARFFAEEIARLSDGRLTMETFGGATLGADLQMQNALIGGAQEMMVGSTATLVGLVPDFGVWDVPFLFANEKEADHVLDGPAGQSLLGTLEAQGLVGLVYWENGFRNLTNSVRPIVTADDLAGIKLRVMQNPVFLDTFAATGASPIPLAFSELFTALEMRTVDGQENPVTTIQSSRFFEVQKYLSITNHVYSPWIVLASKSWWDGLSPEDQDVIRQAAIASRDFEREFSRAASNEALETLESEGMEVTVMAPGELAKLAALAEPVISKVTGALTPEVWAGVQASLAEVRVAN